MAGERKGNDLGRQIDIWAHSVNTSLVVRFHNAVFHGLNLLIEEVDKLYTETEDEMEKRHLKAEKHILGNFMMQNMRNFTLVMHLSNFEEISYNVCRMEKKPLEKSSSLKCFKPGWTSRLGKPVGDVKEWQILDDASEVRNCILHAHGRPKLVKENRREKLNEILKAEKIPLDSGRIAVQTDYLNKVGKAIITLVRYGSNG